MNKTAQQQQGSQAGHLSPVVLFYTHTHTTSLVWIYVSKNTKIQIEVPQWGLCHQSIFIVWTLAANNT